MRIHPRIYLITLIAAGLGLLVVAWWAGEKSALSSRTSLAAASQPSRDSGRFASGAGPTSASVPRDWDQEIANARPEGFADLMRAALAISDPALRQRLVTELAVRWMDADLVSFIRFLDEIDAREISDRQSWAILAPALMEALPRVGDRAALSSYLAEVVQRLVLFQGARDPLGMLTWAREWLAADSLQFALAALAPHLFLVNPDSAWQAFSEISSPLYRVEAIESITSAWAQREPDQALQWVRKLPTRYEQSRGMNSLLMTIAEQQPGEAAKMLTDFSSGTQQDYEAAVAADREANGISASDKIADPTTEEGREGGAAAPQMSPDLQNLLGAAALIGHHLAKADPTAAVSWADSLSDPRLKAQMLQSSLVAWSQQNPPAAAERYLQSNLDSAAASSLFETWAARSPVAAAQRASTVVNPQIRDRAIDGAVSGWSAKGASPELVQWIDALPTTASRDTAHAALARQLTASDPAAAFSAAARISETTARQGALSSAYTRLLASQPEAAARLLSDARLSGSDLLALQKISRSATVSAR